MQALAAVASKCVVPADFHYHQTELPVEVNSIFVSGGGKSLVTTDVRIRVQPSSTLQLQPWHTCSSHLLFKMRFSAWSPR